MFMALTIKTGGRVNPQMRSIILNKKCGTKSIDTAFEWCTVLFRLDLVSHYSLLE